MKIAEVIAKYLQLRDAKEAADKAHKETMKKAYGEPMEKIEAAFLKHFNTSGQTSTSSKGVGTAYISTRNSDTIKDRDAFLKFVEDTGRLDFLDARVSKSALDDYIEKEGDLPPGVSRITQRTVNIKRA